MSNKKILARGAEAIISLEKGNIVKHRIPKEYRLKILDNKIIKQRTKSEAKLLEKAYKIINIPKVLKVDSNKIEMEYLKSERLSSNLDNYSLNKQKEIMKNLGKNISKLHKAAIIHGDLTTSNIILKENKIFLIDFGLGYISHKMEDKAVDLHLLKQALEAKHFKHWQDLWAEFEESYDDSPESKKVLERLKAVEKRGRYKEKY